MQMSVDSVQSITIALPYFICLVHTFVPSYDLNIINIVPFEVFALLDYF
jgi:hypothetical protein